jgi:ribonuclease HII
MKKTSPTLEFEKDCWDKGYRLIAGLDEAGRGPLAGPVTAAAVILPNQSDIADTLDGVRDSKLMTPEQREYWSARIQVEACAWGVACASVAEIETLGIAAAVRLAMTRALGQLIIQPEFLLIDFVRLKEHPLPQTSLIKGDLRCLSIAAASVLAKTSRDRIMCDFEEQYPQYGFAQHKGYATPAHCRALERLGPCPIHRRNFSPVSAFLRGP